MPKKYRKKPIVIEAVQLTWENWGEVCGFLGSDNMGEDKSHGVMQKECKISLEIKTLEGTMLAKENDFIIKGINGEFYPCKPDIFKATYEVVDDSEET